MIYLYTTFHVLSAIKSKLKLNFDTACPPCCFKCYRNNFKRIAYFSMIYYSTVFNDATLSGIGSNLT